jgi:hypothetical protein
MKQHIVQDPTTAEYAGGLDAVWSQWEPALRKAERMLHTGPLLAERDPDQVADALRRSQYKAHTASEFVSGLRPPLAAVDAHDYLVTTLDACRDTLGALALRAEIDDLDEHTAEIGVQSVSATRDAFNAARSCSAAAYHFNEAMQPSYAPVQHVESEGRGVGPCSGASSWCAPSSSPCCSCSCW